MRKYVQDVGKSDIGFLNIMKDRFQELGGKIKLTITRTKSSFSGYGMKFNRETEIVTAGVDHGDSDEG